jgi:hypothetical protein
VEDWRLHRIATLFGEVRVRLLRFLCAGCGHTETGVRWRWCTSGTKRKMTPAAKRYAITRRQRTESG